MNDITINESVLDAYFLEFWDINNIDIENLDTININRFNAAMKYIHDKYIKSIRIENTNSLLAYNESDLLYIIDWFKSKVLYYNIVSIYGLCLLLGIDKRNLYTCIRGDNGATLHLQDAIKNVFELYQELAISKANDTPIGLITNINNNKDIGLLYNKQNMIDTYEVKKNISIQDLPKLSDI